MRFLKSKLLQILGIILILSVICFVENLESYRINKNKVFSNAEIIGFSKLPRGGIQIEYVFFYEGYKYESKMPADLAQTERKKILNKNYLIKLDSTNPIKNYLILDKQLSDTLQAPPSGWKKIDFLY